MQHEVLAIVLGEPVDDLLVLSGAERGDHQRLGLAAGEQRRAVRPGQDADLDRYGADGLGVAAVDALLGVQDVLANDVLLQRLEDVAGDGGDELLVQCRVGVELGGDAFLDRRELLVPRRFHGLLVGSAQARFGRRLDAISQRRLAFRLRRHVDRLLGAGFGELDDGIDDRLKCPMAEHHGAEHDVFGQLFDLGFDHQDALAGAGDH